MEIRSNEYLSQGTNGKLDECNKLRVEISDYLSQLHKESKIKGFYFRTIRSREGLISEGLCDEDMNALEQIANNKYPFLYGIVTYDPKQITEQELSNIGTRFNLIKTRNFSNGENNN